MATSSSKSHLDILVIVVNTVTIMIIVFRYVDLDLKMQGEVEGPRRYFPTYQCCQSACSTFQTCSTSTGPDGQSCQTGGTASSSLWLWRPPIRCSPRWHRTDPLPWSCTSWVTLWQWLGLYALCKTEDKKTQWSACRNKVTLHFFSKTGFYSLGFNVHSVGKVLRKQEWLEDVHTKTGRDSQI